MTPKEALDLIYESDAGKLTYRKFFENLLVKLLQEEEGFDGKRPWGNSGWCLDLEHSIYRHGLVKCKRVYKYEDQDDEFNPYGTEQKRAWQFIWSMIDEIFSKETT